LKLAFCNTTIIQHFAKKKKKSVFIFFCQPVALPSMYVHSRENIRKNPPQDNICNGERLALIVFLPVLSAPTTRRFADSADSKKNP